MRKLFVLAVSLAAAGLLTSAVSAAGASTHSSVAGSALASNVCASTLPGAAGLTRLAGVVRAQSITTSCPGQKASGPPNGVPPLLWHGGPVMGTARTGPVVVTPIFWNPSGHPMSNSYKSIITRYLFDVALASNSKTNVFSTLAEYYGINGSINYRVGLGAPINDTNPLPANGCTLESVDTTGIYADNTGYDSCIDDDQVIAETQSVVAARHLPVNLSHVYVLFIPKHVETCFFAGATNTGANFCTINHLPSAAYCAYHSMASSGMVYANMSYPIYESPVGFTCGTDNANLPPGVIQSPNGNPDADTEISPTSHEIMESITDPDTETGWYDQFGFENGDECAYIYGPTYGAPGQLYNQVIHGDHYITQEEFSNRNWAASPIVNGIHQGGCIQGTWLQGS
jgi:hypothetical protein